MHPVPPQLYGRSAEIATLRDLVDGAEARRGGALVLVGEPGIGKSALLAAARDRARRSLVLEVAGTAAERDLAFGALGRLLRPVLDHIDRVPEHQRTALLGALAVGPPPGGVDPLVVSTGALSLLQEVARHRPVLLLADDLQWIDAASAGILAFCARRPAAGVGLGIVIAGRDDPTGAMRSLPVVRVGPLADDDALALLSDASIGSGMTQAVSRILLRAAAGNPLALRELPAGLTPAQRDGGEPVRDPLHPTPALVHAFRDRIDALAPGARAAALLVACSADDDLATVVPALERLGHAVEDLEDAESGGVVVIDGGRVRFRHPLARGVVDRLAEPRMRRRAHAALASSLDPARDPERWVRHRADSVIGPDESVAVALVDAAEIAARRADFHCAAARLRRAAQLSATVDTRAERLVRASRMAFAAGRTLWAADLGRDALSLRPREDLAANASVAVGEALLTAGEMEETGRVLMAAARTTADPSARAHMLAMASFSRVIRDDTTGALGVARRALDAAAESGLPESRLQAWAAMSVAAVLNGGARLLRATRPRLESDAALVGVDPALTVSLGTIALSLTWAEEWEASRRLMHRVVGELRRAGLSGALVVPLSHAAQIDFRTGDWAAARQKCDEAAALGEDAGQAVATAFTLAYRSWIHAGAGRESECRVDAVHARNLAWGMGAGAVDVHVVFGLGLLELGLSDPAGARDHLLSLAARDEGYGIGEPVVIPWRSLLIEALARLGETRDALRHLRVLAEEAHRAGGPAARAQVARCRGLLERDAGYERHFHEAMGLHALSPTPFEQARTALLFGERLRRERRRADARHLLNTALTAFTRLGAECWADRAREELDASGFRARRGGDAAEGLTPRELQVATTVAAGSTNREAAARLFLSEKTVERHLGNVYRKLGLRSRSQLARWFASSGGNGEDGTGP